MNTSAPRRILVRGVNWLGDAVMTTPALRRLRERFPEAHITLLAPEKLAGVWLNHPCVNEVLAFAPGDGVWRVAGRIRSVPGFDLALVLPNSPRSALEPWLARIPQRVGYARPWRNWFLTRAVPSRPDRVVMRKPTLDEIRRRQDLTRPPAAVPPSAHQIHEYLHLAAAVGANPEPVPPLLEVTTEEMAQVEKTFLALRLGAPASLPASRSPSEPAGTDAGAPSVIRRPIILGINPGAEYGPAKRWPAERFAAVAREVAQRIGPCIWLGFGGTNDRELCEEVVRVSGGVVVNLAGRTSLRELMALLKLCRVLLTNDTGPMHVAAALGTPVVVPFGSTAPELTGPGLPGDPRHHLIRTTAGCAPCFRRECPIDFRCLTSIETREVIEAVMAACSVRMGDP